MAEAVDVRREQVRQILASAAALQAEMNQSEWSEDDDSNEDGQDQDYPQGPLLGSNIRWATAENSAITDGANSILA